MDNLYENLENFYESMENNEHEKTIYEELAEKEQALMLAAQFGKTLLEEKEQLELHIESIKKEYQNKIEMLEQERYDLKLLIESIKNEYENKIYEMNEDLNLMHKQLAMQQNEINSKLNQNSSYIEIINDLTDKNQKLIEQLEIHRANSYCFEEKYNKLAVELDEKERKHSDNLKLINNFKKEISAHIQQQQEIEYLLVQTCNDRDQKCRLLEETNKKLAFIESEKRKLDQIMFQQEQQIIELQTINDELNQKFDKYYHLRNHHHHHHHHHKQNHATRTRYSHFLQKSTCTSTSSNTNSAILYDDDLNDISYDNDDWDIFKIEDDDDLDEQNITNNHSYNELNITWQDECQINDQQINQNSNQSDDFDDNNSLSSFNTTNNNHNQHSNANKSLIKENSDSNINNDDLECNSNNNDDDDDVDVNCNSKSVINQTTNMN